MTVEIRIMSPSPMKPRLWFTSCFLKLGTKKKQNREKHCDTWVAGGFGRLNLHMLHRQRSNPCLFLAPDVQS